MNQSKIESTAERILEEVNNGMTALNLLLGQRLGLFEALAGAGHLTPRQLAGKTGCSERYVQEWLECLAVHDYLEHSPETGFRLSDEVAHVLLNKDSTAYVAPVLDALPVLGAVHEEVAKAFQSGGGVPFEDYGSELVDAIGHINRPQFLQEYPRVWMEALPDVKEKLLQGGRIVDVGSGTGWSCIAIAREFPRTTIDAIELDALSVEKAKRNIREAGLEGRIRYHQVGIEDASLAGRYDLAVAFECLHDMAYPVQALRKMREFVGETGTVLIGDEQVGDSIEENRNFLGRWNYNWSVLHCLPQAMVYPDSAGTGTVIKPSTMRRYAKEAGFSGVEVLPISNAFWRFYRLYP